MFGKRLQQLRKQQGLTQQQMADELDVVLRSYQRYEAGDFQPSFDVLIRIADILDVSIDYLLCRDEFLSKHVDAR